MRELPRLIMASIAVMAFAPPAPAQTGQAQPAPATFETCAACHNGQVGALGPDLHGVAGRKAGTLPGYRYSRAMSSSGIDWTRETLRDFLMNPQKIVPGNRMPLAPLAEPEATALASYLATLK